MKANNNHNYNKNKYNKMKIKKILKNPYLIL